MIAAPFPDLRVVPIDQCVLHEATDPKRVARLRTRLAQERVLRNPPVVGQHPSLNRLMVLDGATRVTAAQSLGLGYLVVQVVEYEAPAIELHTWSHVLQGLAINDLCATLAHDPGLAAQPCTPYAAENALAHRETLAYLAGGDGHCFALGSGADIAARAAALRRLFASYVDRAAITRVPPSDWPAHLDQQGSRIAVVYPAYTKLDLVALVQADALLPAGITRHVIPGRALRVNVPIDDLPLDAKQRWLADWLQEHQLDHGARYYAEPTFLFDE